MIEIHFFATVDHNRDFQNFEPKLEMLIEIDFFSQMRDFRNFETKSKFLSKILIEIEIFEILNQNGKLFRKCWLKSTFPKFWTQIDFFSKMLTEIWTEIDFFRKCWPKSRFLKFWAESDFFFPKMLTEVEIF